MMVAFTLPPNLGVKTGASGIPSPRLVEHSLPLRSILCAGQLSKMMKSSYMPAVRRDLTHAKELAKVKMVSPISETTYSRLTTIMTTDQLDHGTAVDQSVVYST